MIHKQLEGDSDLWYRIYPFLNILDLCSMCFVSHHQRVLAFQTLERVPYVEVFFNALLKCYPDQLDELIDSETGVQDCVYLLLPRISTLVKRISNIKDLDKLHLLDFAAGSVINNCNSESISDFMNLMNLVCPITEEICYHLFKEKHILEMDDFVMSSIPGMRALARAIASNESRAKHVSIQAKFNSFNFYDRILYLLGFDGIRNLAQDHESINTWVKKFLESGIWYQLSLEGRDRVFKQLKSLTQIQKLNQEKNFEKPVDYFASSFTFGPTSDLVNHTSNTLNFDSSDDSFESGSPQTSFPQNSFPPFLGSTLDNSYDSNLSVTKDLYSAQFEELHQMEKDDFVVCKINAIKMDYFWAKTIFNLSKRFLCDFIQSFQKNHSISLVSGKMVDLMDKLIQMAKDNIKFYVNPSVNDPGTTQLVSNFPSLPLSGLKLNASTIDTLKNHISGSVLSRSIQMIKITLPLLRKNIAFLHEFQNLKELHIYFQKNDSEKSVPDLSHSFKSVKVLKLEGVCPSLHNYLYSFGDIPVKELVLSYQKENAFEPDPESQLIRSFFTKRIENNYGPLAKLIISSPSGSETTIGIDYTKSCDMMNGKASGEFHLLGKSNGINKTLVGWSSSNMQGTKTDKFFISESSPLPLIAFLWKNPQIHSLQCRNISIKSEYGIDLSQLPFVLSRCTHLKELEINVTRSPLSEMYMFVLEMDKYNVYFDRFRIGIHDPPPRPSYSNRNFDDPFIEDFYQSVFSITYDASLFQAYNSKSRVHLVKKLQIMLCNQEWNQAFNYINEHLSNLREDDVKQSLIFKKSFSFLDFL
eukprot:gb/GECH01010562.1/.p1 GENE.gb/GECH01010562.1/~~gb/GECH01010562.1/.p1  ORF type:complete len:811 (+),score=120.34 gb/GECH01010562.1/:1-2433(+)